MRKDWDVLSRKEKKEAAQKTLKMLSKKKAKINSLLHLFHLKRIRTAWIYLKKPFAVAVIFIIIWRMI